MTMTAVCSTRPWPILLCLFFQVVSLYLCVWLFTQKFINLGLSTQSWLYIGKLPSRGLQLKCNYSRVLIKAGHERMDGSSSSSIRSETLSPVSLMCIGLQPSSLLERDQPPHRPPVTAVIRQRIPPVTAVIAIGRQPHVLLVPDHLTSSSQYLQKVLHVDP